MLPHSSLPHKHSAFNAVCSFLFFRSWGNKKSHWTKKKEKGRGGLELEKASKYEIKIVEDSVPDIHRFSKKTITDLFKNWKVFVCINGVTMQMDRYWDLWFFLLFRCDPFYFKCAHYLLLGPSKQACPICRSEIWEPEKLLSVSLFASVNPQGFLLLSSHFFSYSSSEQNCSHALIPQLTWELSRVLSVKIEIFSAAKSYLNLLDIW